VTTSVVFDLTDRLVDVFKEAVTDATVYDGYGNINDPGDFVMVGVDDPDGDRAQASDATQTWAGLGAHTRDEEGTITCVALAWTGNPELKPVRAKVKAMTGAIEQALKADPSLGGTVPGLLWTGYGQRTQMVQLQTDDGASVIVFFDIAFKARLRA
jgi:hypothetical protein